MTWSFKTAAVREPPETGRLDPILPAAPVRFSLSAAWRWRLLCSAVLLAALVASRLPLAPRHLVTFDEINFALAIDNFNPRAHQPQPPGYPLFVGLLRLLAFGVSKVETVFLLSALVLSMASLVLLWALGEQWLGRKWGWVAAVLLLCNPPFWLSALTNPVRLGLSAGSAGVALCLFVAWRRRSGPWFVAAAAVLGIASGFRPTLLIELAPLLLWVAASLHPSRKTNLAALAALALAILLWLPILVAASGGPARSYQLLKSYTSDTTRGTSLIGGASLAAALHMASQAIIWSCLGVLTWIWAVPWAVRRSPRLLRDSLGSPFLMLWFLPGLAFYSIFHVADADQTLSIVPVTCLIGARVLASFDGGASIVARAAMVGVVLLLNVFLFFQPIGTIPRASTYASVSLQDRYVSSLVDPIASIQDPGGVTAIFPPGIPGWRQVSYSVPAARTLMVGPDNQGSRSVVSIHQRRGRISVSRSDALRISSCGVIALVDPVVSPTDVSGAPLRASRNGSSWLIPAAPGVVLRSRGVRFIAEDEPCPSAPPATPAVAVPLAPDAVAATIPHFAAGNTYATGFYVINTGGRQAAFSMSFYDDSGKPVSLALGKLGFLSVVSDTLPAYGSRYFEAGQPESETMLTGSALIRSDPSITVQALFRHRAPDDRFYEAAVPASTGGVAAELAFDTTSLTTGIAIANLDPHQAATVVCTARNQSGVVIPHAVSVPVLNPLGHWAGSAFPALARTRGTLECTSNTKIAMVALRAMPNGAISSLPVITK